MFHLYRENKNYNYPGYFLYNTKTNTTSFLDKTIEGLINSEGCRYGASANLIADNKVDLKDYDLIASAENNIDFYNKYPELFI
jgi:hypothetical protein